MNQLRINKKHKVRIRSPKKFEEAKTDGYVSEEMFPNKTHNSSTLSKVL